MSEQLIETISRSICESQGLDPDDDAPRWMICGPNSETLPMWHRYTEEAKAAASVLSAEVERITRLYREAIQLADAHRRRAEAAEARVAVLTTERAQLSKALKWANERVGSLSVPAMEGDNLAIVLCSFFDDGEPPEDETGWGQSAVDGYEQTIRAISDHYNTALAALSHTKEER